MAVMIPFFQQLTGIDVIMFYTPLLFDTLASRAHVCCQHRPRQRLRHPRFRLHRRQAGAAQDQGGTQMISATARSWLER
uniref:Uncharacterized protein n=1 Tax=Arundo donax TaxID=35708 RepID=A0A0A9BTB9_ARUDO